MIILPILIIILILAWILGRHSMRDFQEVPELSEYSLYLIQNPININEDFFHKLHRLLSNSEDIVSLEKLARGGRKALIIFCPKRVIHEFVSLDLLELQDYTVGLEKDRVSSWEATKNNKTASQSDTKLLANLDLGESEQAFFQVVLQGVKKEAFKITIRVVIYAKEANTRVNISKKLDAQIKEHGLKRLNKRLNSSTIFDHYKKRLVYSKEINSQTLTGGELAKLLN